MDRQRSLESFKQRIEKAGKILVVGGNALGVEMAGELIFHNPKKKTIGLVTRHSRLLSRLPPKASTLVAQVLRWEGVELFYEKEGEKIAKSKHYDLVINCCGQKYRADFLKKFY